LVDAQSQSDESVAMRKLWQKLEMKMEQKAMIRVDLTIQYLRDLLFESAYHVLQNEVLVLCNIKIINFVCMCANCYHRYLQLIIVSWFSTMYLVYLSELNTLLLLLSRLTCSELQEQEAACVCRLRNYWCVIYNYQRCEICNRCNSVILSTIT